MDPIHKGIEISEDIFLSNSRFIPSFFELEKIKIIIDFSANLSIDSILKKTF